MLNRLIKAYEGRTRRAVIKFTLADIQGAGAVQTLVKHFGTIPPDAIITYTKLRRLVSVTDGGVGTFALTVGDSATPDNIMLAAAGDVDGGNTTLVVNKGAFVSSGIFTATLTGSVNLNTVTMGSFEVTVFFLA